LEQLEKENDCAKNDDGTTELQTALAEVGIQVYDFWAESDLEIGKARELNEREEFSFRGLMNYAQLQSSRTV
jgi:hypothetical protein